VAYADITVNDRNPVKRWLQRRRLADALWHVGRALDAAWNGRILDFGGGDATLCVDLKRRYPHATVVCYEPSASIREQAADVARGTGVEVVGTLPEGATYDLVLCCEVFEHLPAAQTHAALGLLRGLLAPDGRLVLGVPNEIHAVGLAKGLFRMLRRRGAYDARLDTILPAALGRPRPDRPVLDLDGLPFIYPHTGFDFRALRATVRASGFGYVAAYGSPFHRLPLGLSSEVYTVWRAT
jgi:SAM-dependent methyltransferase